MITAEAIQHLFTERKKERAKLMGQWADVLDMANGDVSVQVAELDKNSKATVVNLFPGGLDQLATRAASVQPDQAWPPMRDGFDGSEARARDRRQAGLAWWEMNTMSLQDRLRYRHYFGFGSAPTTILPTSLSPFDKRDIPHWNARTPTMTYPSPCSDPLDMEPADIIFASRRTRGWMTEKYPTALSQMDGGRSSEQRDAHFDILEYMDCDEMVLVCSGQSAKPSELWTPGNDIRGGACVVLERVENKAGITLAVTPGRITLGRLQGALDQMIPAYHQAARLNALNELAIVRGIFQNEWLQGHPGDPQSPEIITYANGMTGVIGEVAHGTIVAVGPAVGSAQMADMAIDRLERSQRLAAQLPAELGGESGSNIRTARRGEQVLGSAIDMPIQEAQEIMKASKEAELRRAVAVMKGWFGPKKTSFYVPRDGTIPKLTDYTPDETFETDENYVKFSMPGTDANSLVIALGQRVNMGTMSIQTAMETDPVIEDPVMEVDRVQNEALDRALLASIEQGVQQGTIGPDQVAAIRLMRASNPSMTFAEVVQKVHEQAQAKQAAQQQAAPGAPGAQPGLGGGAPAPGGPPSPFSGPPSSPALAQIMSNLRSPAQEGAAEQAGPAQAPAMAQ